MKPLSQASKESAVQSIYMVTALAMDQGVGASIVSRPIAIKALKVSFDFGKNTREVFSGFDPSGRLA